MSLFAKLSTYDDRSARLAGRGALPEQRGDVEGTRRQAREYHVQPTDLEPIDDDRVSARDLRNAVMNAQPLDANRRHRALTYDNVVEHQPGKEVSVELADAQVPLENAVRLADDKIPGIALEPGGVQKREEAENKKNEGQCPVKHDPARQPPQPHEYMLPRAGLTNPRERQGATGHLMIQE